MNVRELIERLSVLPPDLPVTVDDYEGGITAELDTAVILVEPREIPDVFCGELSAITLAPDEELGERGQAVLLITRSPHMLEFYVQLEKGITA